MRSLFSLGQPIVGTPLVHQWSPIVTFSCSCATGRPMLITTVDQVAVCDGCGDAYQLAQLVFDSTKGAGAGVAFRRLTKKKAD